MDSIHEPIKPEPTDPPTPVRRKVESSLPPLRLGSIICLALAIFTTVVGLFVAWSDSRVVNDAGVNSIIAAGRGTAIMCAGISLGVISLVLAIYDLREEVMKGS